MLKDEYQESFDTLQPKDKVVCLDEFGEYETEVRRIDSGFADPHRYTTSRVKLS
jgi:diphthamide synthase (EF-2-diphthine--ammonia ligase)